LININKRTKLITVIVASIVIGAIITFSFFVRCIGNVIFDVGHSFSEIIGVDFEIDNNKQNNIRSILHSLNIEDPYLFGFTNNDNISIDLYTPNAIVNVAKLIPDYNLDYLKKNLSFLKTTCIGRMDILNLLYYIELCSSLEIDIDYPGVFSALLKYYDEEASLFFIDSTEDLMGNKLILTSMVKRILGDKLPSEPFKLESGIKKVYETYNFQMKDSITLYNSGGDILFTMSVFGLEEQINKEKLNAWFVYWKDIYESIPINSLMSALQYSEYLNIARVFDPDYPTKKLQDYYHTLTTGDIENIGDINVLYNILKNVRSLDSEVFNNTLAKHIEKTTKSKHLFKSNLDVRSTVYGVLLARKADYFLNEKKLQNYIQYNYAAIPSIENSYDRTSELYFNIILDQLINGYEQEYDSNYFQSQVNAILKSLRYDQYLAADVICARRIVEIVMDLQIFDVDIHLTKAQRRGIQRGLKSALKNDIIKNSVIINDIFIIDKALTLNLVSNEEFIGIYNKLISDGGACAIKSEEPDILTTYQFMVSLGMINNYEYLDAQKEFVESLMVKDGVYKLDNNTSDINDSTVIVRANAIRYLEIGGEKNDSFKKDF